MERKEMEKRLETRNQDSKEAWVKTRLEGEGEEKIMERKGRDVREYA